MHKWRQQTRMFRLFSFKFYCKYLTCLCLLFPFNHLLINTHLKFKRFENNILYGLDASSIQSDENDLLKCFEEKRQKIHPSPFRTILPNKFHKFSNKTSYLIYEYTRHRQFCRKQTYGSIYASHCPYQNCQFTCDSKLISKSDAILILYSRLVVDRLLDLNRRRNSNQIWLLWHDEPYPPASIYNKILFNWTITYRLDSEVSIGSYGINILRNKSMDLFEFDQWITKNYINRRDEAVW